ncbi:hypothetical protein [Acidimangrovimonas sediminis]|nr:hypothetical protein [Acidimangrovimonas sediminis]
MAILDAQDGIETGACPAWLDRVSPVTLRLAVVGGCALFWAALGVMLFT